MGTSAQEKEDGRMKRLGFLVVAAALVLACGCGQKETVVRLKQVPEIDHSAIDSYVEFVNAEIAQQGLMVLISGKAKVALGQGLQLKIDRFKGGTKVDSVNATAVQAKLVEPLPGAEGQPAGQPADPAAMPPGPPPGAGVIPSIEPGDPVEILIDATMEGGAVSKLVISPISQP